MKRQFTLRNLFGAVAVVAIVCFLAFLWQEGNRMVLRIEEKAIFDSIKEGRIPRDKAPEWFTDEAYERFSAEENREPESPRPTTP